VAKAKGFNQGLNNFVMRDWPVGSSCLRYGDLRQLCAPNFGQRAGNKRSITHGIPPLGCELGKFETEESDEPVVATSVRAQQALPGADLQRCVNTSNSWQADPSCAAWLGRLIVCDEGIQDDEDAWSFECEGEAHADLTTRLRDMARGGFRRGMTADG